MSSKETVIRIILLTLLMYSVISFASVRLDATEAKGTEAELAEQLEALELNNSAIRRKLDDGWSDEEIEQLARQRLGLVMPGEIIFHFITDREE